MNGVDGSTALQCVDCAAVFESPAISTRRVSHSRHAVTRAGSPRELDKSAPALDPAIHERETARPPASSPRNTPAPHASNVSGSFQLAHVTPRRLFSTG